MLQYSLLLIIAGQALAGSTWSGGMAGVSLNSTELEIYAVQSDSGTFYAMSFSPFYRFPSPKFVDKAAVD